MTRLDRAVYAAMYGPAKGDKIRLGDTGLVIEIERDHGSYGDECKFGGGKVLRDQMGQMAGVHDARALDVVITNVVVVDWTGIYKADVGIKHGRIVGIGKSGNPDVMSAVDPAMIVGVTTEAIAGEGLVLTAGGIDAHIHFICPQQAHEAPASGVTTFIGGGPGPTAGTTASSDPANSATTTSAPSQAPRNAASLTSPIPRPAGYTSAAMRKNVPATSDATIHSADGSRAV